MTAPGGAGTLPFPPKSGAGGIPKILTTLIERLDEYLADPASCLPTLNTANGADRQQRLDRRIACVQLLRAQIKYMDLPSMRVGIPQANGGFLCLTLKFLAKQAGLGLRRAERAMRDLQSAGLVRTWQRCEQDEAGNYRGLAAIRQLPAALFGAFGLGKWLRHERSKAVLRRYRAAAAAAKTERRQRDEAQGSLFLHSLKHRLQQSGRRVNAIPPTSGTVNPELEDQVRRRIGALKLQHPDWDRDACYDQAYRELAPPGARQSPRSR
ncbi:hypothetical protein [Paraburkholderia nemoris]|uniref:hypothetical protein n=1 Tax=Paraburkholderia nemoris TaxID=2793076 RepID=UPI001F2E36EE|nr:hypothetical protein [Paraburkholderia nemoris]